MDAEQEQYLIQARSDLRAFDMLPMADVCHQLHYLQMITEKLAKAYFWRKGNPLKKRHDYFVKFLRRIGGRGDVGIAVGIKPSNHWEAYVDGILPVAQTIERMAPAEANDGPNAEYPGRTPPRPSLRQPLPSRSGTKSPHRAVSDYWTYSVGYSLVSSNTHDYETGPVFLVRLAASGKFPAVGRRARSPHH